MRIFKYILLLVVVCLSVSAAESNKTMADINIGSIGGVVFVQETHSDSVDVLDITSGHILRVNALYESVEVVVFFFICVYAPVLSTARMNFLNLCCTRLCW